MSSFIYSYCCTGLPVPRTGILDAGKRPYTWGPQMKKAPARPGTRVFCYSGRHCRQAVPPHLHAQQRGACLLNAHRLNTERQAWPQAGKQHHQHNTATLQRYSHTTAGLSTACRQSSGLPPTARKCPDRRRLQQEHKHPHKQTNKQWQGKTNTRANTVAIRLI